MQILSQSGDRLYLQNSNVFGVISLREGLIEFPNAPQYIARGTDQAELEARFLDIVEAIDAGDVRVYDTRKAVGYWKPKPARAKKAAAKSPTPPPAEPKS